MQKSMIIMLRCSFSCMLVAQMMGLRHVALIIGCAVYLVGAVFALTVSEYREYIKHNDVPRWSQGSEHKYNPECSEFSDGSEYALLCTIPAMLLISLIVACAADWKNKEGEFWMWLCYCFVCLGIVVFGGQFFGLMFKGSI